MNDKTPSRIAFEAWAKDGLPSADMSQTHAWLAQSCAWLAWQAATAEAPIAKLTDDQIMDLAREEASDFRWPSSVIAIARAIERALKGEGA